MKEPCNEFHEGLNLLGAQISWGPNFLGPKKFRGPNEIGDHFSNSLKSAYSYLRHSSVHLFMRGGGTPGLDPRGDPWRGPRWLYIRSWLGDAAFSKMGNTHRQLYKLHQF